MSINKKYLIGGFALALGVGAAASTAHAVRPFVRDLPAETGPSLNVGDKFWVDDYDPKRRAYSLITVPVETPKAIWASPEALAEAVEQINLAAIKAAPYSIMEGDFVVNRAELELLTNEQLWRRAHGH